MTGAILPNETLSTVNISQLSNRIQESIMSAAIPRALEAGAQTPLGPKLSALSYLGLVVKAIGDKVGLGGSRGQIPR